MTYDETTLECDHPTAERIREAYRELPRRGCIRAVVDISFLAEALSISEQAGFFGLTFEPLASGSDRFRISGRKGKSGPCYDGGRVAQLKGPAVAVLDDDSHLIFGKIPVCEKTGEIYALDIYKPFIEISSGDPDLMRKINDDPTVFNCDTFQKDVERLLAKEDWVERSDRDLGNVIYRGPFKVIICKDGSVVRRGQVVKLPKSILSDYVRYDAFAIVPEALAKGERAPFLRELYNAEGGLCLLGGELSRANVASNRKLRMDALSECTDAMAIRLLGTIERGDSHFILAGSRPDDELGCCPSADVGEAMDLVDAGILEASRMPGPPDSCTNTIFAFRGELSIEEKKPQFSLNADFRAEIKAFFQESKQRSRTFGVLKTIVTYTLLSFVVVSLGYATTNLVTGGYMNEPAQSDVGGTIATHLGLEVGVTVLLVRNAIVCDSCETAKSWCLSTVDRYADNSKVRFRETTWEEPGVRQALRDQKVVETAAVLVVDVTEDNQVDIVNLTADYWTFHADQEHFSKTLATTLTRCLEKHSP